jgi:hypothetical protein
MSRKTQGQATKDKVDSALDQALEQTFPASDPLAITEPSGANNPPARRPVRRRAGKRAEAASGAN